MRFLCLYKSAKPEGTPPTEKEMAEMGKLIEDSRKSGRLLATEGCLPTALGARIRRTGESFKVIDGPFTEAKEVLGGYWMVEANSKEELVKWAQRCPADPGDVIEIRQIFDAADFAPKK